MQYIPIPPETLVSPCLGNYILLTHFDDFSAKFQIIEFPAVRRTQPSTKGQNFFNNPCPIATMVTW